MKRVSLIIIFIVLALTIAACGGGQEAAPEPTVAPADEAPEEGVVEPVEETPTEEPVVAEPTAEPVPTEEPAVNEATGSPLDSMEHQPDPRLVDKTWEWISRDPNGNDTEAISIPNPENYTLLFNADGSFTAQLDCNSGAGGISSPHIRKYFHAVRADDHGCL